MNVLDAMLLKVLAQVPRGNLDSLPKTSLTGGPSAGNDTFSRGMRMVFGVAGGAVLVMLAYGCLRYVLSRGDPEGTTKARNTIIDALIGMAIVVSAFGLITFVTLVIGGP